MRLAASLVFVLLLTSCAGVFKGTSQSITFTSNPEGAEVFIDGVSRGVTPLTLKLKKNKHDTAMIKKEGYKTATINLEKSFDPVTFVNIIWDSSTTDLITGAAYEYDPNSYYITLSANEAPAPAKKN